LADAYILIGIFGLQPSDQTFPNARDAAENALALDDTLAEAHTSLAEVRKDFDWDWKGAERGYRRAIELNGNDSTAHHWYAQLLAMLGRHQEAMAEIEEARHVDPLSPPINAYVAYIYLLAGRDDQAVSEGRQAVALEPHLALAHFDLGRAYLHQRRMPEAASELGLASRLSGGTGMFDAELAFAYARSGNRDGALAILHDLKGRGPTRYVSPFDVAVVYTGLGDKPAALDALERAYETRVMRMTALSDPEFAELHGEPRFRQLLERMGLPITGQ
jgi:tetratricopeptide (TPR) repeat protein